MFPSGPLRSVMKKVASRLPYVGRLMAERTIIAGERDRIDEERVAVARDRDRIAAERDGLASERDRLLAGRDELLADNAALRIQVGAVESERDRYKAWMPPGHYYSPVPSLDEVRAREAQIFGPPPATLPGVDLNEEEQWALLDTLAPYIREQPFGTRRRAGQRYCFDNLYYSHYDAVFLYAMIRHLRPRRIVEIGSGHSSCVILDTNDLHFAGAIACTFVEPHPEALLALIRETDRERVEIVARPLQDVDAARFEALEANNVLIVDSTHVSKTGSDVNRLLFNVLPRLHAGVRVHVHERLLSLRVPARVGARGARLERGVPDAGVPAIQRGVPHRALQHLPRRHGPGAVPRRGAALRRDELSGRKHLAS